MQRTTSNHFLNVYKIELFNNTQTKTMLMTCSKTSQRQRWGGGGRKRRLSRSPPWKLRVLVGVKWAKAFVFESRGLSLLGNWRAGERGCVVPLPLSLSFIRSLTYCTFTRGVIHTVPPAHKRSHSHIRFIEFKKKEGKKNKKKITLNDEMASFDHLSKRLKKKYIVQTGMF